MKPIRRGASWLMIQSQISLRWKQLDDCCRYSQKAAAWENSSARVSWATGSNVSAAVLPKLTSHSILTSFRACSNSRANTGFNWCARAASCANDSVVCFRAVDICCEVESWGHLKMGIGKGCIESLIDRRSKCQAARRHWYALKEGNGWRLGSSAPHCMEKNVTILSGESNSHSEFAFSNTRSDAMRNC